MPSHSLSPESFSLLCAIDESGTRAPLRHENWAAAFRDLLTRGFIQRQEIPTHPITYNFIPSSTGLYTIWRRANLPRLRASPQSISF